VQVVPTPRNVRPLSIGVATVPVGLVRVDHLSEFLPDRHLQSTHFEHVHAILLHVTPPQPPE